MNDETLNMYLQNIEEYVMVKDKVVTYKWLSKTLDIHINTAKQLLFEFKSRLKEEVNVTYLIGGILHNKKGCKILIVNENDVAKLKTQFKILTSEHVYSVQRANTLDVNVLYAVDKKKKGEEIRLGAIHYNRAVTRPKGEIERARQNARIALADVEEESQCPNNAVNMSNKPVEAIKKETATLKGKESKKELKAGGIADMFAVQSSRSKKRIEIQESCKPSENTTAIPKTRGDISMYFSCKGEENTNVDVSVIKGLHVSRSMCEKDVCEQGEKLRNSSKAKAGILKCTPTKRSGKIIKENLETNIENRNTEEYREKRKKTEDSFLQTRKRVLIVSESENSDVCDSDENNMEVIPSTAEASPKLSFETDEVLPSSRNNRPQNKSCKDEQEKMGEEEDERRVKLGAGVIEGRILNSTKSLSKRSGGKKTPTKKSKQSVITNFFKKT
ncbi:DNA polymerase delta subunit 3-like [Periplaneta americana]|uniref:DNA polymerase delta subunit 3-like n=1 Tax=Periplaneta americana TaxID=6978 RepID=UPI0037E941EE